MNGVAETSIPVQAKPPQRRLGRLKVFLGIAPGVGKTAAMMELAEKQSAAGRRIVVYAIHSRGELDNLDSEGEGANPIAGGILQARDITAIQLHNPDIVVIDELVTSEQGVRHSRRFQEALTLLEAGLDVYGTLNIYELASRAEITWEIAGLSGRDAIPDSVLDSAEIVFVDVPPSELLARVKEGQIRLPEKLGTGRSKLFDGRTLLELREMAARLVAEHASREAHQSRRGGGPARGSHRLLVAMEFGWEAQHLILLARRLAGSLNAPWVVLCIEAGKRKLDVRDNKAIRVLELARELGAEVITVASDDFVGAVLRVAHSRNITQIITGKTSGGWLRIPFLAPAYARLARRSGGIDVYVAEMRRPTLSAIGIKLGVSREKQWQWWATGGATGAVMACGFLIKPLLSPTAASLLSLLTVAAVAAFLERGPALLATTLIAAGWDYFFIPPYFHFGIARSEDKVLMAMYFIVAWILGQYTTRIRSAEVAERQREARATALYLLMRELSEADTPDEIVERVMAEMKRCFNADVAIFLADEFNRLQLQTGHSFTPCEKDFAAAAWVLERRQWAGKFTGNLPLVETMLVPLESSRRMVGVLGVRLNRVEPPSIHERNLIEAFARQTAVSLDRQHLREISDEAELIAASERLGKTLLDSISHEIRTPLTVIQAAATDLEEGRKVEVSGQAALVEIQEATVRLDRLVGQVLDITRLESGHVKPLLADCEIGDIVHVSVVEMRPQLSRHRLNVQMAPDLPLVRTDYVFVQQALMNLLSNAAIHTASGTEIELRGWVEADYLFISVADRGPGIDPALLPRVFDKFSRGASAPTGGVGLGLSLVKGFIKAVGGSVTAKNREGGGAEFTIMHPLRGPKEWRSVAI